MNGFEGVDYMDENTPLSELLGDVYDSDFGELGEPATGAAIATATAVISTIAGLLKGIGSIFPKKEEGSQDFENTEGGEQGASSSTSMDENNTVAPSITEEGKANPESNIAPQNNSSGASSTAMMKTTGSDENDDGSGNKEGRGEGMCEK